MSMGYKEYSTVMAIMQGDLFQLLTMAGSDIPSSYSLIFIDEASVTHSVEFVPVNVEFID